MVNRITYSLVAVLLILATTGITISKHFCHDRLAAISVLIDASCEKDLAGTCCDEPTTHSNQNGCCEDEAETIKVDLPFLTLSTQDIDKVALDYLMLPATIPGYLPLAVRLHTTATGYTLPSPVQNRQVLFQSFLC